MENTNLFIKSQTQFVHCTTQCTINHKWIIVKKIQDYILLLYRHKIGRAPNGPIFLNLPPSLKPFKKFLASMWNKKRIGRVSCVWVDLSDSSLEIGWNMYGQKPTTVVCELGAASVKLVSMEPLKKNSKFLRIF